MSFATPLAVTVYMPAEDTLITRAPPDTVPVFLLPSPASTDGVPELPSSLVAPADACSNAGSNSLVRRKLPPSIVAYDVRVTAGKTRQFEVECATCPCAPICSMCATRPQILINTYRDAARRMSTNKHTSGRAYRHRVGNKLEQKRHQPQTEWFPSAFLSVAHHDGLVSLWGLHSLGRHTSCIVDQNVESRIGHHERARKIFHLWRSTHAKQNAKMNTHPQDRNRQGRKNCQCCVSVSVAAVSEATEQQET